MTYARYPNHGLDHVKVGDTLIVQTGEGRRSEPWETKVVKVGRSLVHCEARYGRDQTVAFRKENGAENTDRPPHGTAQTPAQVEADIERAAIIERLNAKRTFGYSGGWGGGDLTNDQLARIAAIIEEEPTP